MLKVSTLFILIMFLSSSIIIQHIFSTTASKNVMIQLDYISTQLDFYLSSTVNFSKTLIIDDVIQKKAQSFNQNPSTFSSSDRKNLETKINNIIQSNNFIYSVSLFSKDKNLIASTYSQKYQSDNTLCESDLPLWFTHKLHNRYQNDPAIHLLSFQQPFYSLQTGEKLGYIELSIHEDSIHDIYMDKASLESQIFMIDHSGIVQSSDGNLELGSSAPIKMNLGKHNKKVISPQYIMFSKYIPELDWHIINRMKPSLYYSTTYSSLIITILVTILCIICCSFISKKLADHVTTPIYDLIRHIFKIKNGFWTTIDLPASDSDIKLLYDEFNKMIRSQEALKDSVVKAQKEKDRLSLNLLHQQVNPHFLYNTLDNICALAELDEKETLMNLVMNLSTFYRTSLCNGEFLITLKEELSLTEAYLHIMEVRYYHKFTYEIDCPKSLYNCTCIKLLLQPLIENSIYHGIKGITYTGVIKIKVFEQNDQLMIIVSDNGRGFAENDIQKFKGDKHHFGIWSIDQRVQLYFGKNYGLVIEHGTPSGCTITISLPLRKGFEDEL